jgi:peptidoglycan/LPS O-acetylase OafA/YrhL
MSLLDVIKVRALAVLLLIFALIVSTAEKTPTGAINTKAYLAMVIGGFITMLVGGALFIFSYVVINAIIGAAGSISSVAMCNSMTAGIATLTTGLQLASLVFVAIGFYMVVSVFIGIGGTAMGRGGEG